jgi:hypothetical protein
LLRSELYELEKSVGAILDQDITDIPHSYLQKLTKGRSDVEFLCGNLKKKWTHELFSNAKEPIIRRYVAYHEAGIVRLSDSVSSIDPPIILSENLIAIHTGAVDDIRNELESVLEFLHNYFYQYFDNDHKASNYRCQHLYQVISEFRDHIASGKTIPVDKTLIDIIHTSLSEVAEEGLFSGLSFRQVYQLYSMVQIIKDLFMTPDKATNDKLLKILYQQNFNSFHFYNWYQDYVLKKVTDIADKKERKRIIDDHINFFAGIFVNPDKALQPELPSTDIYINAWLKSQTGTSTGVTSVKAVLTQLPLNLSVPQFAIFIRIFYKTGCFPVENIARITRFFCENFTTKKQDHISYKSFGRAFYNIDQPAAAIVRDILQKMLNHLNKTYFP